MASASSVRSKLWREKRMDNTEFMERERERKRQERRKRSVEKKQHDKELCKKRQEKFRERKRKLDSKQAVSVINVNEVIDETGGHTTALETFITNYTDLDSNPSFDQHQSAIDSKSSQSSDVDDMGDDQCLAILLNLCSDRPAEGTAPLQRNLENRTENDSINITHDGARRAYFQTLHTVLSQTTDFDDMKRLCSAYSLLVEQKFPIKDLPNLDAKDYQLDSVASCLYPYDDAPNAFVPIQILGDGNCLPRIGSLFAYGNETHHVEIRVRICMELCQFEDSYLEDSYLNRGTDNPFEDLAMTLALYTDIYVPTNNDVCRSAFRQYAKDVLKINSFCSMWSIFALASVLGVQIFSIYPSYGGYNVRQHLHRILMPRQFRQGDRRIIHVMWTNTMGKQHNPSSWTPNHFVAVLPRKEAVYNSTTQKQFAGVQVGTHPYGSKDRCHLHPDEELVYLCKTCNELPLCYKCHLEGHHSHNMIDLIAYLAEKEREYLRRETSQHQEMIQEHKDNILCLKREINIRNKFYKEQLVKWTDVQNEKVSENERKLKTFESQLENLAFSPESKISELRMQPVSERLLTLSKKPSQLIMTDEYPLTKLVYPTGPVHLLEKLGTLTEIPCQISNETVGGFMTATTESGSETFVKQPDQTVSAIPTFGDVYPPLRFASNDVKTLTNSDKRCYMDVLGGKSPTSSNDHQPNNGDLCTDQVIQSMTQNDTITDICHEYKVNPATAKVWEKGLSRDTAVPIGNTDRTGAHIATDYQVINIIEKGEKCCITIDNVVTKHVVLPYSANGWCRLYCVDSAVCVFENMMNISTTETEFCECLSPIDYSAWYACHENDGDFTIKRSTSPEKFETVFTVKDQPESICVTRDGRVLVSEMDTRQLTLYSTTGNVLLHSVVENDVAIDTNATRIRECPQTKDIGILYAQKTSKQVVVYGGLLTKRCVIDVDLSLDINDFCFDRRGNILLCYDHIIQMFDQGTGKFIRTVCQDDTAYFCACDVNDNGIMWVIKDRRDLKAIRLYNRKLQSM